MEKNIIAKEIFRIGKFRFYYFRGVPMLRFIDIGASWIRIGKIELVIV